MTNVVSTPITDHLDLMRHLLLDTKDSPSLAVYRYIRAMAPRMEREHAMRMSACLIGSTAGMIELAARNEPLDVPRLAAGLVACILPAGVDLGLAGSAE